MSHQFGFHTTGPEVVEALASRITGRTFAITGASAGGLGAQTALYLAAASPSSIILLGRTESKVEAVLDEIKQISPSTSTRFVALDLADLASVRSAASTILASTAKIDVLINNAGIMALHEYTTSPLGVEMQFAANHLGHFLLTNLLMPLLLASGPGARIVNLSSAGHCLNHPTHLDFSDVNFDNGRSYDEWRAYAQSKTANVLFAVGLAERLRGRGVRAYSLHPGAIFETALAANVVNFDWPAVGKIFEEAGRVPSGRKTIAEGCSTTLAAALDPALDDYSGAYLNDCKVEEPVAFASSPENAEKLWELSEKLVGEKFSY